MVDSNLFALFGSSLKQIFIYFLYHIFRKLGIKRNSLSHQQDVKRLVIEHVDVADFKKLGGDLKKQEADEGVKNYLANILKETWIKDRDGQSQVQMYRFLYPSGKPREEVFDKYCEEGM